jgi:hypothetical protein
MFEEGDPGTETGRKDDPLTQYREKANDSCENKGA